MLNVMSKIFCQIQRTCKKKEKERKLWLIIKIKIKGEARIKYLNETIFEISLAFGV